MLTPRSFHKNSGPLAFWMASVLQTCLAVKILGKLKFNACSRTSKISLHMRLRSVQVDVIYSNMLILSQNADEYFSNNHTDANKTKVSRENNCCMTLLLSSEWPCKIGEWRLKMFWYKAFLLENDSRTGTSQKDIYIVLKNLTQNYLPCLFE